MCHVTSALTNQRRVFKACLTQTERVFFMTSHVTSALHGRRYMPGIALIMKKDRKSEIDSSVWPKGQKNPSRLELLAEKVTCYMIGKCQNPNLQTANTQLQLT